MAARRRDRTGFRMALIRLHTLKSWSASSATCFGTSANATHVGSLMHDRTSGGTLDGTLSSNGAGWSSNLEHRGLDIRRPEWSVCGRVPCLFCFWLQVDKGRYVSRSREHPTRRPKGTRKLIPCRARSGRGDLCRSQTQDMSIVTQSHIRICPANIPLRFRLTLLARLSITSLEAKTVGWGALHQTFLSKVTLSEAFPLRSRPLGPVVHLVRYAVVGRTEASGLGRVFWRRTLSPPVLRAFLLWCFAQWNLIFMAHRYLRLSPDGRRYVAPFFPRDGLR